MTSDSFELCEAEKFHLFLPVSCEMCHWVISFSIELNPLTFILEDFIMV